MYTLRPVLIFWWPLKTAVIYHTFIYTLIHKPKKKKKKKPLHKIFIQNSYFLIPWNYTIKFDGSYFNRYSSTYFFLSVLYPQCITFKFERKTASRKDTMQYTFHFVPNKQLKKKKRKKKGQYPLNKVHQFQWVSVRKRPKDSAGTSQKSHPGRPLIVFREYSTKTKNRRIRRGKETSTLKSQEKHSKSTSLEISCKRS